MATMGVKGLRLTPSEFRNGD